MHLIILNYISGVPLHNWNVKYQTEKYVFINAMNEEIIYCYFTVIPLVAYVTWQFVLLMPLANVTC